VCEEEAKPPGKQIPRNGSDQTGKNHHHHIIPWYHITVDCFGNSICNTMVFKNKKGNRVK
jgi:hypothetical protein